VFVEEDIQNVLYWLLQELGWKIFL